MIITREIASRVRDVVDVGLVDGLGQPEPGQMCVEAAVCFALGEPHSDNPSCVSPALRSFKIILNDANWSSSLARTAGLRRLAVAQLGSRDTLDEIEFSGHLAMLAVNKIIPRALRLVATMEIPINHIEAIRKIANECEIAVDLETASDVAYTASNIVDAINEVASDIVSETANHVANAAYRASEASEAANHAANAANNPTAYKTSEANEASEEASEAAGDAANSAANVAANEVDSDKMLSDIAEEVVQILIKMNVPGTAFLDLVPLEKVLG